MARRRRRSNPLRDAVAQRAELRCEYCLIHEEDAGTVHQLDHVTARQHGGETTLANLAFSCLLCNENKGTNLVSRDPMTRTIVRLFNPRRDDWHEHFQLEEGLIVPRTAKARATAFLLKLNAPERIEERQRLQGAGRYPR